MLEFAGWAGSISWMLRYDKSGERIKADLGGAGGG